MLYYLCVVIITSDVIICSIVMSLMSFHCSVVIFHCSVTSFVNYHCLEHSVARESFSNMSRQKLVLHKVISVARESLSK